MSALHIVIADDHEAGGHTPDPEGRSHAAGADPVGQECLSANRMTAQKSATLRSK